MRAHRRLMLVPIQSYQDLNAWQEAIHLARCCYQLTREFPQEEMFSLTSQIRRAAASVPANIAEGYGRENTKGYIQFLRIAQGSLKELETHLILAREVGILQPARYAEPLQKADQVGRILRALIRSLQSRLK
jgi:four helix bundle protein